MGVVWRINLENETVIYLCSVHLAQWRLDGGDEPAHKAKGLTEADCAYCQAAKDPDMKPWGKK